MSSVANGSIKEEWIYSPVPTNKNCVLISLALPYVPWNGGTGHGGSYIWKCPKRITEKDSDKEVPKPKNLQDSWPHWRGHPLSFSKASSR